MAHAELRDKQQYRARTRQAMQEHLAPPSRSIRQKMALTCRMLAAEGHESGLSGQVSARGERQGTYWMLRLGLGFDEATAGNLLLCDDDLRTLEGTGMANAANRFHLWIYRHRPEVSCIVHTHPPHACALSMIGVPLAVSHMDTAIFYEDCAYLPRWPGLPIGDEEGRIIHEALGGKRSILLAHHGLLTASRTIEESAMMALFLERAAGWQLRAMSAGTIGELEPELAREARDWRLQPSIIGAQFEYFARRVLRLGNECLDDGGTT